MRPWHAAAAGRLSAPVRLSHRDARSIWNGATPTRVEGEKTHRQTDRQALSRSLTKADLPSPEGKHSQLLRFIG